MQQSAGSPLRPGLGPLGALRRMVAWRRWSSMRCHDDDHCGSTGGIGNASSVDRRPDADAFDDDYLAGGAIVTSLQRPVGAPSRF